MKQAYVTDFSVIRPAFEQDQESMLDWIAKAHTRSEMLEKNLSDLEAKIFYEAIKQQFFKIGLGKDKIEKRGTQFEDSFHEEWHRMSIYKQQEKAGEIGLKERMEFYTKHATDLFEAFYPEGAPLPSHLIHASCTGYVSPSAAQKLVSRRQAGHKTMVTHAYHMGCYASIPSLRMAEGFLQSSEGSSDIVHTELCTIHMNPSKHSMEQLVIHSLFGDGFIKYSVMRQEERRNKPALKLLAIHEEILAGSIESMSWQCEDWGFAMKLSKEVPFVIARALPAFVETLVKKAHLPTEAKKEASFAIHPGGSKIIQQVAKHLELQEHQIAPSQKILKLYGNMSSATLPHIWEDMLKDPSLKEGSYVISLAYGPGLTLCGAVFQKVG